MKRRNFLKTIAGAAAAVIAARVAPRAEAAPKIPKPPGIPMKPTMTVMGDGTGQQWYLDPAMDRDLVYGFRLSDFPPRPDDARMYTAFARMEFEQRNLWPRQSRITGL